MPVASASIVGKNGLVIIAAESIQLHILQEISDLFHTDDVVHSALEDSSTSDPHVFMVVSVAAVTGPASVSSIWFQGMVQGMLVSILLDSGSSHTLSVLSWPPR